MAKATAPQHSAKGAAEAMAELRGLEGRLKSCSLLERDELLAAAGPTLSQLVSSLHADTPIPLSFVSSPLLVLFPNHPHLVCQVLAAIKDKRMLRSCRRSIADLYSSHKEHRYRLFMACRVYDGDGLGERVVEDLNKVRARIRADAAALSNSHKKSLDLSVPDDLLQCIPAMAAAVGLQLSYRLTGALVDLFVVTRNAKLLEAAESLVVAAPCRHPLLPVVLSLMASARVCTQTLDLIVHPRRAASMKTRHVPLVPDHFDPISVPDHFDPISVPTPSVPTPFVSRVDVVASEPLMAGKIPTPSADAPKRPTVEPPFRPNVAKKAKEADDDLPQFCMEGPDE